MDKSKKNGCLLERESDKAVILNYGVQMLATMIMYNYAIRDSNGRLFQLVPINDLLLTSCTASPDVNFAP